jgi:hypothetical protein
MGVVTSLGNTNWIQTADIRAQLDSAMLAIKVAFNEAKSPYMQSIFIPAMEAGVDLAEVVIAVCPTFSSIWSQESAVNAFTNYLTTIDIIALGDSAGIDASNKSTIVLKHNSTTLVTKAYDNETLFPDSSYDNLPITRATVVEGDTIKLSITNGTTAATPNMLIQLGYYGMIQNMV